METTWNIDFTLYTDEELEKLADFLYNDYDMSIAKHIYNYLENKDNESN